MLCDFHREQAWVRWFNDGKHNCRDIKDEALAYMRGIAYSLTKEEMIQRIGDLKNQEWWRNRKNLRKYVTKWYLKIKKVRGLNGEIQNYFLILFLKN